MEFYECTLAELASHYTIRDGFIFYSITEPTNVRDAIVIHIPQDAKCESPRIPPSQKTLDEHISFINEHQLEKALVIADNIEFLPQCPSLQYLWIIPSDGAPDEFDFSPLYQLPQIKYLKCETQYGINKKNGGYLDYSKLRGIQFLDIDYSKFDQNFEKVSGLKTLLLRHYGKRSTSLGDVLLSDNMDVLELSFCGFQSLSGIGVAKSMRFVHLEYCRRLEDISALEDVKDSLVSLNIMNCPKITDFSVLSRLHKLEDLRLKGSNVLPNLSFLRRLPNLRTFVLKMDVLDGDLKPCLNIPFVFCHDKKHFSHKNVDLPKNTEPGNNLYSQHGIEVWRI